MVNENRIRKLKHRHKIHLLCYITILICALSSIGYWSLFYRLNYGWDHWIEPVILIVALALILYILVYASRKHNGNFVIKNCSAEKISREEAPNIFNSVERIAIAAHMSVPQVYLTHKNIIALAVAQPKKKGALILNPDLLDKLDHAELDGIIAHEISHIANYDCTIRSILFWSAGFSAGLSISIARSILHGTVQPEKVKKKNREAFIYRFPFMILVPFLLLYSSVVIVVMKLIYNQQEYLADINSVSLTRNPDALMAALAKLALKSDSPITNHAFFFEDAISTILKMIDKKTIVLEELLNIDPPVIERIGRIKKLVN